MINQKAPDMSISMKSHITRKRRKGKNEEVNQYAK
jgi:hypothetical protein